MSVEADLPFVDEHRATIDAPRDAVWTAVRRYADSALHIGARNPLGRLLGTTPPQGFEVIGEVPLQRLELGGRHRFSRYRLVFDLTGTAPDKTTLTATTYAVFPGWHGRVYRALVIGSRLHVVAVRRMLSAVRRSVR